ncbi:MAG: hypothetical protein HYT80_00730 [Euryarchaeota archaeon]|nr:hypothetical protein [Euryarchaeota archaeon]
MKATATAFAPGHVTGFFEICDDAEDPARIGSRGAGFSVKLGVTSRVSVDEDAFPAVEVRVNRAQDRADTTRSAVELLLGGTQPGVLVEQTMDLPVSQGFGMSSAGALSATLALASILGRPRKDAVWAAHTADVTQRSGLGDVVGAAVGGFELRLEPGLEPYGRVASFRTRETVDDVLLAVVDQEILTKRILTSPADRAGIKKAGADALRRFQEDPGLRSFADASRTFSLETRLASDRIIRVYNELERLAFVSQCMLGGSVFVFGRSSEVRQRLSRHGPVFATKVDFEGARLLPTG